MPLKLRNSFDSSILYCTNPNLTPTPVKQAVCIFLGVSLSGDILEVLRYSKKTLSTKDDKKSPFFTTKVPCAPQLMLILTWNQRAAAGLLIQIFKVNIKINKKVLLSYNYGKFYKQAPYDKEYEINGFLFTAQFRCCWCRPMHVFLRSFCSAMLLLKW